MFYENDIHNVTKITGGNSIYDIFNTLVYNSGDMKMDWGEHFRGDMGSCLYTGPSRMQLRDMSQR